MRVSRAPDRRRPVALAPLGIATLSLAAVVALFALNGCATPPAGRATAGPSSTSETTETSTPPRSTTVIATSTPQPTATPAAGWTLGRVVEHGADPATAAVFFGVHWHEVSGWIAYGKQENTETGRPGVWTSGDGLSWTLAELPDGLEGHRVADVTHAEVDGSIRFVAVLTDHERSRILVSNDGTVWERPLATTPDSPTMLHAVAHGPAGFVATGSVASPDGRRTPGRIWQSPDGAVWTESAPAALESATPLSVEVVSGRYVAVGFPNVESSAMSAWISSDGLDWATHEIAASSPVGCSICVATDALNTQMVVLGTMQGSFAGLTSDGTTWTLEPLGEGQSPMLTGAEILDDGAIIVAGAIALADGPHELLIWVRDAGSSTWRPVDWEAQLSEPPAPGTIGLGRNAYVAAGSDRTLILVAEGTVLLTAARLP